MPNPSRSESSTGQASSYCLRRWRPGGCAITARFLRRLLWHWATLYHRLPSIFSCCGWASSPRARWNGCAKWTGGLSHKTIDLRRGTNSLWMPGARTIPRTTRRLNDSTSKQGVPIFSPTIRKCRGVRRVGAGCGQLASGLGIQMQCDTRSLSCTGMGFWNVSSFCMWFQTVPTDSCCSW